MDSFTNLFSFLSLFDGVLPWIGLFVLWYVFRVAIGSPGRRDKANSSDVGAGDLGSPGGGDGGGS